MTTPTTGEVKVKGRIASLLEVGTGFHPDLSGRENIYLNGAILGMRKHEITRKLDEIIDFSGCDRYIDTPVKRYSSGMYVRLAFAVAAHLDPEILIVDEVLAVGDAEFQKKCIGKMKDVAKGGRTVIFVSHNMQAIFSLTNRVTILENGHITFVGDTNVGLEKYSGNIQEDAKLGVPYVSHSIPTHPCIMECRIRTSSDGGQHLCGEKIGFEFDVFCGENYRRLSFSFQICDELNRPICHFWLLGKDLELDANTNIYRLSCDVPNLSLYMGKYSLTTWLSDRRANHTVENLSEICVFEVSMGNRERNEYSWRPNEMAYVVECSWNAVGMQ